MSDALIAEPGNARHMEPLHVALRIAYDGSRFEAYARDPTAQTVEDALIRALQEEGLVEGSFRTGSRTDAGVSALENVCKVTLERAHLKGLVPALQRNLPLGLWVTGAAPVDAKWNPRHAKRRHYRYDRFIAFGVGIKLGQLLSGGHECKRPFAYANAAMQMLQRIG